MTRAETRAPEWQVLELLAATPVSRTWKVTVAGRPAVLREDEPGAAHLKLDRHGEVSVLRAAAVAGLGPEVLYADPGRGRLLTRWLPGRAFTAADLQDPANLQRAARLLRQLHATPLAGPALDIAGAIERYAATAGAAAGELAAAARAQLRRCLAGSAEELCFCHHDPMPGNFVASPGGEIRLIDWEYAGLGYPGFDLAGLAVGASLAVDRVSLLHTAYRGRTSTLADLAQHRAWEALYRGLSGLWQASLDARPV